MINRYKYKIRFVYFGILAIVLYLLFTTFIKTGNQKVVGAKPSITGQHFFCLDIIMECYVEDNGILPSLYELQKYMGSIKGGSLNGAPFNSPEALIDEWGNKLIYVMFSTNSYEFISIGKDCKRNTDDDMIWETKVDLPAGGPYGQPVGIDGVPLWQDGSKIRSDRTQKNLDCILGNNNTK